MQSETSMLPCPKCNHPAQLSLFRHTDEQGHPLHEELAFDCRCGHQPAANQLLTLWAATHTAVPT